MTVPNGMKVWIEQDLCTGDGICEDEAPDVFEQGRDGTYVVKQGGVVVEGSGSQALANVPLGQEEAVIRAADRCPGECIFIEL